MQVRVLFLALLLPLAAGCATWSSSEVQPADAKAPAATNEPRPEVGAAPPPVKTGLAPTDPARVAITEADITDRPYRTLAELAVTVNKSTIFHPDPTKELVAEKLREEAAKLGADAVVLVRYGTVGVSLMSWGSLDGKGRAVAFVKK